MSYTIRQVQLSDDPTETTWRLFKNVKVGWYQWKPVQLGDFATEEKAKAAMRSDAGYPIVLSTHYYDDRGFSDMGW